MSTDATECTVRIYGDGKLSKMMRVALINAGCEVSVAPAHDIAITGVTYTVVVLDDLFDPTEPKMPSTQRVYGPQRKGKGGKIRRW